MANESDSVLIGLIVTIAIVGVGGGIALVVYICLKWRECLKQRSGNQIRPGTRHRHSRRRRIRVRNVDSRENTSTNNHPTEPFVLQAPPAYTEVDISGPPAYNTLGIRQNTGIQGAQISAPPSRNPSGVRRSSVSRTINLINNVGPPPYNAPGAPHLTHLTRENTTRGHNGSMPPSRMSSGHRQTSVSRNFSFSHHHQLSVPGTGTTNTPAGSMFTSSNISTRDHSASSNVRSMNMVLIGLNPRMDNSSRMGHVSENNGAPVEDSVNT